MRSLLHDYLATDGDLSTRLGRMPTTDANIFQRHPRDKNKARILLIRFDLSAKYV